MEKTTPASEAYPTPQSSTEIFTSPQKPGVVLVREGRYSIQLDELDREALKQLNRKERRVYAAKHRTVARMRLR
jgi:hypothetical protein